MEIQPMSDSEKEIMSIIWENGGTIFISSLLEKVEERNKDWQRTTVRTFLKRLKEKGLIRAERHGKMCAYIALVSENDYFSKQAHSFVNDVFQGDVKYLLTSLFGQNTLRAEEISELEQFWKKGKEGMV